jgi:hypothetical protein
MIARSIERNGPEFVVIGAGPHGLAVAAHLKSRGVATHAFGESISFWRRNMPKGMKVALPPWPQLTFPTPRRRSRSKPGPGGKAPPWSNRWPSKLSSVMASGIKLAPCPTSIAAWSLASSDRQWISAGARRWRGALRQTRGRRHGPREPPIPPSGLLRRPGGVGQPYFRSR